VVDAPKPIYPIIRGADAVGKGSLLSFSFDPSNSSASTHTGTIDRETEQFHMAPFIGTISADGTVITLSGGGHINVDFGDKNYVAHFVAQPVGSNPQFGVFGLPTIVGDIPNSGSALYLGQVELQIIDDKAVFDLIGDAQFGVNFSTKSGTFVANHLDGTRYDGVSPIESVSDVAVLTLSDVTLTNNLFSGGIVSLESASVNHPVSGGESTYFSGSLYGPGGAEFGGILLIDDSSITKDFILQGTFTGKK
jgi:hypothetical protein